MIGLDDLRDLLLTRGSAHYGEAVTLLDHSLQAATLAERLGADDSLIVAALFHDIGHALDDEERDLGVEIGPRGHERTGEGLLANVFGPDVTRPVALHVLAKRYLCAREPGYLERLSDESRRSLDDQGGPLSNDQCDDVARDPQWARALDLRRFDDDAKTPGAATESLDHFLSVAHRLSERR